MTPSPRRRGGVVARGPSAVAARGARPLRHCPGVWGGARLSSRALLAHGVGASQRRGEKETVHRRYTASVAQAEENTPLFDLPLQ